ncbi:hypothetical protein C2S52_016028 [Perilla frutescens var. hirtella]|nr:hypothetical protein C2S52_016028 [Perilla frutescens var. hirtella]
MDSEVIAVDERDSSVLKKCGFRTSHAFKLVQVQKEAEMRLNDLLVKEKIMWKQRSCALGLADGDKNIAFFHRTATGQKKRNQIRKIELENVDIDMAGALEAVELVVTSEMITMLTSPFTKEEITVALSQMHPLKAPGPDDSTIAHRDVNLARNRWVDPNIPRKI